MVDRKERDVINSARQELIYSARTGNHIYQSADYHGKICQICVARRNRRANAVAYTSFSAIDHPSIAICGLE